MALSAAALVSIAEARAALGLQADAVSDANVEMAINMASAQAESVYCFRPLKARAISNVRITPPRGELLYPAVADCDQPLPDPIDVASAITITVSGTAQTVWRSEADGDPDSRDVVAFKDYFYRAGGWGRWDGNGYSPAMPRNILLSYTGGFNPVPDDLKEAALELIQKMWGPLIMGRGEVASFASTGGSLQTLEGQWAGGTTPWALTRRSQDVFYSYRRVRS